MSQTTPDATASARRHLLVALAGGIVLVAAWTIVALTVTVPAWEETLFRGINGLPDWVEYIGWPIMQTGSVAAIPVIAVVAWRALRTQRIAIEILVAGGAAWVAAKVLKSIANRGRPGTLLNDIALRPLWEGLGFPSGHSAVAAAIAAVLSVWLTGRWLLAIWAVPVIVGFMRVYTAAHFPLDVVAGWGLGVLVGTAVAGLWRHRVVIGRSGTDGR